jgi:nucleotide-binding universal stress UspA family protein
MVAATRGLDSPRQLLELERSYIVGGTIVCGVSDTDGGRGALKLAVELSERLGLRLVLAHVAEGFEPTGKGGDESLTTKQGREGAQRLLAQLVIEHGLDGGTERRSAVGDRAELLARIAAEEAADLIVIGSRPQGRFRRGLCSTLAAELESETPIPVLIAPLRRGRRAVRRDGLASGSDAR